MTGILKVDQWKDSGDNTLMTSDGAGVLTANAGITIPSGATLINNGTATGTGNINITGTVTATAISSTGLVVQYVVTKLTGQRSWSHSAFDEWHYVMEQAITPKLSTSTLYCRIVLGGYENSNANGRGHIKLFENSSSAGRSFGYNYGNIANVPGNQIGENMLAQDSSSTGGTITTNAVGSVSNTTGAAKYFIFVGAQQDNSTGNFYVNRWANNETYIEAWEVV
jgi:hypothetical protein